MKLRNKVLISVSFTWLIFLILNSLLFYYLSFSSFFIIFILLGIISSGITLSLLYVFVVKRIELLNQTIIQQRLSRPLEMNGNDEIAQIASRLNEILNTLHHSQEEKESSSLELNNHPTALEGVRTQSLSQLAHYDSLTSLPNRIFFNEMLNKTLSHARRHNKILAILFIDIDRFKNINDVVGKKDGDKVLKEIARRFNTVLRSGDILARLVGDEFIILLNDIGHPKFASPVAEKLLQICSMPVTIDTHQFFMTASIGICIFPNDGSSLEDLQKNADLALYKAKRSGGGIYQYFSGELGVEAQQHIQLETALQKAVANNEFVLYYQPKLNLADSTITGVEALIRWNHPEFGLINPIDFIPLAEESGIIMQIGRWVLREACRACKSWQDQGYQPIDVAVNLSPKQFAHKDILKLIEKILQETHLDPSYLQLEITETTIMDDVETTSHKLNQLKKMGVTICIDDFGTGYTSISYLKKFPIDILKIDQTFVKGLPENTNDLAITSAMIALAHNLSMRVVAEGVENVEQLQYLVEHNCDMVQGYYFSRPLPEQKIVLQLKKMGN